MRNSIFNLQNKSPATLFRLLMSQNLYLFRNMQSHKVIVAPCFALQPRHLRQIGEHRPQLAIRPDHWLPFAVVTGLKHQEAHWLASHMIKLYKHPLGKTTLPIPMATQFPGWAIPEAVTEKTTLLCTLLLSKKWMHAKSAIKASMAQTSDSQTENSISQKENTTPDADNIPLPPLSKNKICIHWERDEYRRIPSDVNLMWPPSISHQPLKLIRNRFPVVPGFNTKTRNDVTPMPQMVMKKGDFTTFQPMTQAPVMRKKGYPRTRQDSISKQRGMRVTVVKRKRILVPVVERWAGKSWIRKSRRAGDVEGASMPNGTRKPKLSKTLQNNRRKPRRILDPK